MNCSIIVQKLSELGYKGAKEAYDRQCEDTSIQSLSFDERLFGLLDAGSLKIKNKSACISEIDYHSSRRLDKSVIHTLAALDFIRMHHNIIITGKTGTGKSYLAQALGNRAIEGGLRSYYVSAVSA